MRTFSLLVLALAATSASAFTPLAPGLARPAHPALSVKSRHGVTPRSNAAVVREVSVLPFAPAAESYANIWVRASRLRVRLD